MSGDTPLLPLYLHGLCGKIVLGVYGGFGDELRIGLEWGLSRLLGFQIIQLWVHTLEGAAAISLERKHQPRSVNKRHAWDFIKLITGRYGTGVRKFSINRPIRQFLTFVRPTGMTHCGITNQEIRWTWEPPARRGAPLLTRKDTFKYWPHVHWTSSRSSGFEECFWNMQRPLPHPPSLPLYYRFITLK